MSVLGHFWGFPGPPRDIFMGGKRVPNDRIGYEIQCAIHFDQCSTHLKQLELLMANVEISGHKMAQIWPQRHNSMFWGTYPGPK